MQISHIKTSFSILSSNRKVWSLFDKQKLNYIWIKKDFPACDALGDLLMTGNRTQKISPSPCWRCLGTKVIQSRGEWHKTQSSISLRNRWLIHITGHLSSASSQILQKPFSTEICGWGISLARDLWSSAHSHPTVNRVYIIFNFESHLNCPRCFLFSYSITSSRLLRRITFYPLLATSSYSTFLCLPKHPRISFCSAVFLSCWSSCGATQLWLNYHDQQGELIRLSRSPFSQRALEAGGLWWERDIMRLPAHQHLAAPWHLSGLVLCCLPLELWKLLLWLKITPDRKPLVMNGQEGEWAPSATPVCVI